MGFPPTAKSEVAVPSGGFSRSRGARNASESRAPTRLKKGEASKKWHCWGCAGALLCARWSPSGRVLFAAAYLWDAIYLRGIKKLRGVPPPRPALRWSSPGERPSGGQNSRGPVGARAQLRPSVGHKLDGNSRQGAPLGAYAVCYGHGCAAS